MDRGAIAYRERKLGFPFDYPPGGLPIVRTDPVTAVTEFRLPAFKLVKRIIWVNNLTA